MDLARLSWRAFSSAVEWLVNLATSRELGVAMQHKARLKLHVDAECEACGHKYSYDYLLRGSGSGGPAYVEERAMGGEYGCRRCPKCKYLQSWQEVTWRRSMAMLSVLIAVVPAVILYLVAANSSMWPTNEIRDLGDFMIYVYAAMAYLLVWAIIAIPLLTLTITSFKQPNRRWHKKNGPAIPWPKFPKIRSISPDASDWF